MARFLFINPPLVLEDDFIDYPYFANHGLLALGADLASARALAEEIEALCAQYIQARVAGTPVILPAREMLRVRAKFATYGRRKGVD